MVIIERILCPMVDCEYHTILIRCSVKALEDHLFFDHGYNARREQAKQLGIIGIDQYGITSRELARVLAKEGIIDE